jgi:thioredoxin-like negative regulator of GroEL
MTLFNTAEFFNNVIKAAETLDMYREVAAESAKAAAEAAEVAAAKAKAKENGHVLTTSGARLLIEAASTAAAAEASAAAAAAAKSEYMGSQEQVKNLLHIAAKNASEAIKTHYEKETGYW